MIKVKNLSTAYGKKQVVTDVSFEVEKGNILGILGENGSGKSTIIKSICNILPHKGNCYCDELQLESLSTRQLAKYCSYVPQKSGLELELTVLEVVLMGFNSQLGLLSNPGKTMIEKAKELLISVGFQDKIDADFMSLSEGQKQLCILLRAMIADSKLLLMDEPENALDIPMRFRMMSMTKNWVDEGDRAAIVALHDIDLAINNCDKCLLIKDGKNVGIINPKSDTIEEMEEYLSLIYGHICIRKVTDNSGKAHLVMIKEEETL